MPRRRAGERRTAEGLEREQRGARDEKWEGKRREVTHPTKRLIRSFFLLARAYAPRAVRSNFNFHHGPSGLLQHNTTVCNNFFHATFPHI
jgi:hypothetical protein